MLPEFTTESTWDRTIKEMKNAVKHFFMVRKGLAPWCMGKLPARELHAPY